MHAELLDLLSWTFQEAKCSSLFTFLPYPGAELLWILDEVRLIGSILWKWILPFSEMFCFWSWTFLLLTTSTCPCAPSLGPVSQAGSPVEFYLPTRWSLALGLLSKVLESRLLFSAVTKHERDVGGRLKIRSCGRQLPCGFMELRNRKKKEPQDGNHVQVVWYRHCTRGNSLAFKSHELVCFFISLLT